MNPLADRYECSILKPSDEMDEFEAAVRGHPEFAMECWIGGELGSPIERDRAV